MRHLVYRSLVLFAVAAGSMVTASCGDDLVVPDDGDARSLTIVQGATQTGTAGQPLPITLVVEVRDDVGRPVAQQPLTIALEDGGSISPSQPITNGQGRASFTWTLGPSAGMQELSVATAASGPSVTFRGEAAPATANVVSVISGNGQSARAGNALADSLTIRVTDEFGNPVSDAPVTWTTVGGSLSPGTTTTSEQGYARTRWTLGPDAGSQTAFASVAGVPDPVSFSATATPGPIPVLVIDRQPDDKAKSGEELRRQPRIRLQDGEGHDLQTAGVAVTAKVNGAGAILEGTTTVATGGNGRADFTDLAITAPSGNYTLTFSASGYTSVTSAAIEVEARPVSPTESSVVTDSSSFSAGGTALLTATVRDADGNPISGITVTFSSTGSGHTLQQPGASTDANGVATGSITATISGPRTITTTAGSVTLSPPLVLQVSPGLPSPATTDAQVPGGTILTYTNIVIRAADAFGNVHTTGGHAGRFSVRVSGANTASPQVNDNGDGTYSARFFKLVPGTDTVSITLDGTAIKGSPYQSS